MSIEPSFSQAYQSSAVNRRGTATARRGRNPTWPYVPVIEREQVAGFGSHRTEQIRGRAFATREEAVAYAQKVIEAREEHLQRQLADPRMRALRKHYGLPADV